MNNPVNDCEKARDLLLDEMARWDAWPEQKRKLFAALLRGQPEFDGFLDLMGSRPEGLQPQRTNRLRLSRPHLPERRTRAIDRTLPLRTGLCIGVDRHNRSPLHHAGMGTAQLPKRRVRHQKLRHTPALQAVPTATPNSTSTAASSRCSVTMPSAPTKGNPSRSGRHGQPSKDVRCWRSSRPVAESHSPSSCRLLWQDALSTDSRW